MTADTKEKQRLTEADLLAAWKQQVAPSKQADGRSKRPKRAVSSPGITQAEYAAQCQPLRPGDQEIILLFAAGMTRAQIAGELGRPYEHIRVRLAACRGEGPDRVIRETVRGNARGSYKRA